MNKTGRNLGSVCVYYDNVEAAAAGGLVKGGKATYGAVTLPVPSEAEMRWIDNDQHHSVKVKLTDVVPKRLTYEWTLYFVINADGTVQAKAIKDNDLMSGYSPFEYTLLNPERNGFNLVKLSQAKSIANTHEIWFSGPAYFREVDY